MIYVASQSYNATCTRSLCQQASAALCKVNAARCGSNKWREAQAEFIRLSLAIAKYKGRR